jgi:hypothetical protein
VQFLCLVRGGCYKEALKLAGKILVLDPDNATVQEFQLVLAEGATLRTLWGARYVRRTRCPQARLSSGG